MTESPQTTPDPEPATAPTPPAPAMPTPAPHGPTVDVRSDPLDEVIHAGHIRDAWANTIAFLVVRHEPVPIDFLDAYSAADFRFRGLIDAQLAGALK